MGGEVYERPQKVVGGVRIVWFNGGRELLRPVTEVSAVARYGVLIMKWESRRVVGCGTAGGWTPGRRSGLLKPA